MDTVQLPLPKPRHPYLVAIDSDGCVFDSMTAKQLGCYLPAFIESFGLEDEASAAGEVWSYVNLGSPTRGINRFKALVLALDLLAEHPRILATRRAIPRLPELAEWTTTAPALSNEALEAALSTSHSRDLLRALTWSRSVNRLVEARNSALPPFPGARAAIEAMKDFADLVVLSQTPAAALNRDWEVSGLSPFAGAIYGQEAGSKRQLLAALAEGRDRSRILMLGDSPGDREAAFGNSVGFFPILPSREAESWRLLLEVGLERLRGGRFAGEFQNLLDSDFSSCFPPLPPWKQEARPRTSESSPDLVA